MHHILTRNLPNAVGTKMHVWDGPGVGGEEMTLQLVLKPEGRVCKAERRHNCLCRDRPLRKVKFRVAGGPAPGGKQNQTRWARHLTEHARTGQHPSAGDRGHWGF